MWKIHAFDEVFYPLSYFCYVNWNSVFPLQFHNNYCEGDKFFQRITRTTVFMATRPTAWWVTLTSSPCKATQPFGRVDSQVHETNQNHYISTFTVAVATKLGRMVTYLVGLLPIKSNGTLITWQIRIISPLPQCLWPPNFGSRWLTLRGSYPASHMTF